jgi:hypothetical protein
VRAPSIISPSIVGLILLKGIKERKQTPFPFPPICWEEKYMPRMENKKQNTIEEDHVPTELYSIQPEKKCRYQKESAYIPFGIFFQLK